VIPASVKVTISAGAPEQASPASPWAGLVFWN